LSKTLGAGTISIRGYPEAMDEEKNLSAYNWDVAGEKERDPEQEKESGGNRGPKSIPRHQGRRKNYQTERAKGEEKKGFRCGKTGAAGERRRLVANDGGVAFLGQRGLHAKGKRSL